MAKNKVVNKTRRANNEGSIYKRKDGRWAGYVSIGFGEQGKPIRKTIYGKSQTEVAKKLSEISGRINSNSYDLIEKQTFEELMLEWMLTFKKSAVSPRTFEGNIRNFKLHIVPIIGKMKVYEVDTYSVQKVVNKMIEEEYSNDTTKKIKHLLNQFFEYAIDNKWVQVNPVHKVRISSKDRKIYNAEERYKALPPEMRDKFLSALNEDGANFIKPLCYMMMFAGLRVGEALALKWKNFDENNKILRIERAITQVPKFDSNGNILSRVTVVGDTKTTCSVRDVPLTDIVIQVLKEWKIKQLNKQQTNAEVCANLILPTSFIFANDDGSVRTYSGTRKIFDRFKKRNNLNKCGIHFHTLRHTFSNMLFELNENPKVIQQLLGHRDVKTTITVYNSVNSEYVKQTIEKFNEKLKEEQFVLEQKKQEEILEKHEENFIKNMSDDEFDDMLQQLIEERKMRKLKKEKDFEM